MTRRTLRRLAESFLTEAGWSTLRTLLGLLVGTAVSHVSALGVLLLLVRALPPSDFGVLSFALTAQGYLALLGSLACGSVVIREGVRRPADIDAIATSFLTLTATSSALVCAGSLIAVGLAPVSSAERWLLMLVALATVPASMNIQPLFDMHHRQAHGVIVGALVETLALLAVLGLWRSDSLTLPAVGAVYATKWGLISSGQLLVYHSMVRRVRWSWSPADIRQVLRSSWPILFAATLFSVPLSSGVVLVRLRIGTVEAALFGLAYQVASAYQIFAALGVQVVQPHIFGRWGLHTGFLAKLAMFTMLLLGGVGVLAFAGGWAVVSLLLPPVYHAALPLMAWLLAAAALLTVGRMLSVYLIRFDDGPVILGAYLLSALLYVAGCLLLPLPRLRPGAAVLAAGAALVGTAICLWRVRTRICEAAP
jgi:O-antigen/teichoic acid export membrane protein